MQGMFQDGISSPRLNDWLNWVAGREGDFFIALPMIQRGSVWKPSQVITLWDSLLRGMPIGSMLLSRLNKDAEGRPIKVRRVGESELIDVPEGGGYALLDGQQRTLAMLLGWPDTIDQQRTLWVDFADKPAPEQLFRMHVTTTSHPYGFRKSEPNSRLSLAERREARANDPEYYEGGSKKDVLPWDSHLPLPLPSLVKMFDSNSNREAWVNSVRSELQLISHRGKSAKDYDLSDDTLVRFHTCLERIYKLRIPLIEVPEEFFDQDQQPNVSGDDPALAILFKRIGTGGTALSDADYVYSVIKHHLPETFQLVEEISDSPGLPRLLGPTDIVMTAVRLAAAELEKSTDYESPQKLQFDRLRKAPDFLKNFLGLVKDGRLKTAFDALTEGLRYSGNADDIGLPMHGFVLVSRPILQVLLRWLLMQQAAQEVSGEKANMLDLVRSSREELLRFILYAEIAVPDTRRASEFAFAWLKERELSCNPFPGKFLVRHLIEESLRLRKDIAFPLPSTVDFQRLALRGSTEGSKKLALLDKDSRFILFGYERFDWSTEDESDPKQSHYNHGTMQIFKRWWGHGSHQHPLLLWLQRHYVDKLDKDPEEVRSDDETPYDYDHICPSNHWYYWTGASFGNRLIDFLARPKNGGHWRIGTAIGNVRVWYASDNRSDGDKSAVEKLTGTGNPTSSLLTDSAIQNFSDWEKCSGKDSSAKWSAERANEFQKAVEQRTLDLYKMLLKDLKYESAGWFHEALSEAYSDSQHTDCQE